jgi:hypothetical protein
MDDVKCYLCGDKYQPSEGATWHHVKHAGGRSYRATAEQLAIWLEACQFERDAALRSRGHGITPVDQAVVRIIADG